ncbi:18 kDa heat shock protein [Mycobacteroides salmoniphilum]|uniref:18 kDa heat shock protein n=1 Tax=Mycobacteroides salmoniphilum TaxID=404941 RepID=A0A4R8RYC3_9MYCO|nr:Hsp20/alpha crystallin family protein [Mycobacteroides salmoniphilum]TDZ78309.1 18 kDa heat shock protein [Mycobacteroides salmoniphilum]
MSNVVWTRRSPFAQFDALVRQSFGPATSWPSPGFVPAAEVAKDGDDALVRLDLPGVDVDKDVTVEVERGTLVVSGERRDGRAEQTGDEPVARGASNTGRVLREVRYGKFRRTFTLPTHVTGDAISASYDTGILTIKIAGAYANAEAQKIEITK